jgi:hypothetical protein
MVNKRSVKDVRRYLHQLIAGRVSVPTLANCFAESFKER